MNISKQNGMKETTGPWAASITCKTVSVNEPYILFYLRIKKDISSLVYYIVTRLATHQALFMHQTRYFPVKSYKHCFPAILRNLLSPFDSHLMTSVHKYQVCRHSCISLKLFARSIL